MVAQDCPRCCVGGLGIRVILGESVGEGSDSGAYGGGGGGGSERGLSPVGGGVITCLEGKELEVKIPVEVAALELKILGKVTTLRLRFL